MSAQRHPLLQPARARADAAAHRLGRLAIASLHAELSCSPKPGLVTPFSRGSHDDMDAATFMRSLFALRGYFVAVAATAALTTSLLPLRALGMTAESAMLAATGGINTHRGAIFSLGLLVAQSARLQQARPHGASAEAVCLAVGTWRDALLQAPLNPDSPGQRACREHGVQGVREQAADGYPLLREVAIPVLRDCRQRGINEDAARVQTLMHLIAVTDDLNLLHRGGLDGLRTAQALARGFISEGGVTGPGWQRRMQAICVAFEAKRLSPGGSADLLACALFLLAQESADCLQVPA